MYIQGIAEQVAQQISGSKEQEVFLDPVTITAIINIITNAIKLIKACVDDDEIPEMNTVVAYAMVQRPSMLERITLRRSIRKELGLLHSSRAERTTMYHAILQVSSEQNELVIGEMFAEVE